MDDAAARERVATVEALLDQAEALPDSAARELCTELVASLLDTHGDALERLVQQVRDPAALARDELVSHLLLVHGLHPTPVEARVRGALDEVRPYLESHGGNVELVSVEDGKVGLRLEGSCSGCPSSAVTLRHGIEEAIYKAAPDVERVVAEDAPAQTLLQIDNLVCPLPEVRA
jgi:Fe-S cluster biogenesis protein NfuA